MRNWGSIGLAAGFTIGTIASAISLPAMAASERSAVLEEVVVTARKQEESAQDVPIAITALTQELENSSIRNLQDLNGYSPNLVFENNGSRGGGGANINIRGISPTRSDDNSFDAPVAVVIDGIYLGTLAGQVLENFDLERVEILRGPQGTLFGKNTVGGVVNVIRSRPTGEFGGKFKLTAGDDGQQEARLVLNTSITDNLALKIFGTKIETEIGFIIGKAITQPISDVDALKAHVEAIVPVIELPAGKLEAAQPMTALDLAAANVMSANYIVGRRNPVAKVNPDRATIRLAKRLAKGDEEKNKTTGAAAHRGQWQNLLHQVNHALGQRREIKPGHLILTGALGKIIPAEPGDWSGDFGALGKINFSIQ